MSEWLESEHRPFGWFTDAEGTFYKETVTRYPRGILVELGPYLGRSLSYVLQVCRELKIEVYAVDVWNWDRRREFGFPPCHLELFNSNLKRLGFERDVCPLQSDNVQVAVKFRNESVSVIMIDTLHTKEQTLREIDVWLPRLEPNGAFLFHDYTPQPVTHPEYGTVWDVGGAIRERFGKPDEVVDSLARVKKK